MIPTRRDFFIAAGATASALVVPGPSIASDRPKKRHIVTLSFDDGFRKSFLRTAEIYEKHKLSACLNVVAAWSLPPFADFKLWNELQNRGHEDHAPRLQAREPSAGFLRRGEEFDPALPRHVRREAGRLRPQAGDL